MGRVVREVNGLDTKKSDPSEVEAERAASIRFRSTVCSGPVLACLAFFLVTACAAVSGPEPPAVVWPSGAEFRLEIADDFETRRVGYMFREHVGPNEGMLFVFDEPGRHPFWMKNCKVSLDIIWLDASRRVVEIAHDQQPCPVEGPCSNVFPMRAASYVLEVAGGTARRDGLKLGDSLAFYLEDPARR
jgi:uncharacterized membrane protein (UPF0127 family)